MNIPVSPLLMNAGALIDMSVAETEQTALHVSVAKGNAMCVKELVSRGAFVDCDILDLAASSYRDALAAVDTAVQIKSSIAERIRLGRRFASAVFLHRTPWLASKMQPQTIPDGSRNQLLVEQSLTNEIGLEDLFEETFGKLAHFVHDKVAFHLGLKLTEIAHGRTLPQLANPDEESVLTAFRVRRDVENYFGIQFARVVDKCIQGLCDIRSHDMFQRDIALPLEELVKMFV